MNRNFRQMTRFQPICTRPKSLHRRRFLAPVVSLNLQYQKCAPAQNADLNIGVVRFPADCVTYGQTTIIKRMNGLLFLGFKIDFAIDGVNIKCNTSRSFNNTGNSKIARAYIDDKFWFRMVSQTMFVGILENGAVHQTSWM